MSVMNEVNQSVLNKVDQSATNENEQTLMSEDSLSMFNLGNQDASELGSRINFTISSTSCFYRLGVLSAKYQKCPTRLKLIKELCREFSFYSELPNLAVLTLKDNYSHRLLKRTMDDLGYHIPSRPNLKGFNAWRVS